MSVTIRERETLFPSGVRGCWKGGDNLLMEKDDRRALLYVHGTWMPFPILIDSFSNHMITSSGHVILGRYSDKDGNDDYLDEDNDIDGHMWSDEDNDIDDDMMQWSCWFQQRMIWSISLQSKDPVFHVSGYHLHIWSLIDGSLTRYVLSIHDGVILHHNIHEMPSLPQSIRYSIDRYVADRLNDEFFAAGAGEDDELLMYRIQGEHIVPFMSNFTPSHNIERICLGRSIHLLYIRNEDDTSSWWGIRTRDEKILWQVSSRYYVTDVENREKYFVARVHSDKGFDSKVYDSATGQVVWEQEAINMGHTIYFTKDSTELLVVEYKKMYTIPLFPSQKKALQSLLLGVKTNATMLRFLRGHLFVF